MTWFSAIYKAAVSRKLTYIQIFQHLLSTETQINLGGDSLKFEVLWHAFEDGIITQKL